MTLSDLPDSPTADRETDAIVAEKVMGLGTVLGCAGAWGECGPESVSPEPGDHPVYLDECICDEVRQGNAESIARCVETYEWTDAVVAEVRAKNDAGWIFGHSWQCLGVVQPYSTDIGRAWEVVEKVGPVRIEKFSDGWYVRFGRLQEDRQLTILNADTYAVADTAPLAICLAALKAVEAA